MNSWVYAGCNCGVQNPTIIGQTGQVTNYSSYASGVLGSGCYVFQGTVQIDINVLIDNCTLEMEAGSEIKILSSKRLNLTGSTIYACDTLWKGITVNSGARLWASGNDIYDAQYAIKPSGTATVTLYDNEFYHNYVAFYIPGTGSTTSIHNVRLIFQNNIIDNPSISGGATGLLRRPNFSGMSPNPNGRAFAGIYVNNANLIIGSKSLASPSYRNYISNVMVGVNARYCKLECHRLIINNMLSHGNSNRSYTVAAGVGILVRDCNLQATRDTITNAICGISGDHSWLANISLNEIGYVRAGIHDIAAYNSPEILDNEIHHTSNLGIKITFPVALLAPLISYNRISTDGTTPSESFMIGISLNKVNNKSFGGVLSWNELVLHSKSNGIDIRDCDNIGVGYNTISFSDASQQGLTGVGIVHNDTRNGFVIENTVTAASGFNKIVGFHSFNAGNTRYCCNYTSGTDYGFNFLGNCRRTNGFGHNEIRGLSAGLRLAASTMMGNQFDKGNLWLGSFPTATYYKGAAVNVGNLTDIKSSSFYVESCDAPLWPPTLYPYQNCDGNQSNWFRRSDGTSDDCNEDYLCDAEFLNPDRELEFADIDEGDEYLARGQMANGDYGFTLDYEGRRQLLERLRLDAGALNQNSYVDSFYSASSGTSYAELMEIDFDLDTLLSYSSSILETLDELKEGFRLSSDSISILDSLITISSNNTDSTSAINLREAQLAEMDTLLMDLLDLWDDHQNTVISGKEDLIDANDLVDSENIIDSNEVVVNAMYLEMLAEYDFSFSESQADQLLDVAEQCPREGGVIVYQARALYNLYASQSYDDYDCLDTSMVIRQNSIARHGFDFSLKSNPVHRELTLFLTGIEGIREVVFELCNAQGILIKQYKLTKPGAVFTIDISSLQDGFYFVRSRIGDQILKSQSMLVFN